VNIYKRSPAGIKGGADALYISAFKKRFLDVFICADCGFSEKYLTNKSDIQLIKENWEKHVT